MKIGDCCVVSRSQAALHGRKVHGGGMRSDLMKVFMALPTACLRVLEAALDQRLSVCVWTVKY